MVKLIKTSEVTVPVNNCTRCNHQWVQRVSKRPMKCPSCQSPNWDRVKVVKQQDTVAVGK